jgi:hypothetical protein
MNRAGNAKNKTLLFNCHSLISHIFQQYQQINMDDSSAVSTVTLDYYDEAEKHFISTYAVNSALSTDANGWVFDLPTPLKVILLRVKKEVRNFGTCRLPATVYKLVVMDGSQNVFLCTLNTGLAKALVDADLTPGSTCCLYDYNFITLDPPYVNHGVMTGSFLLFCQQIQS